MESVLEELATLLRGPAKALYPDFRERLAEIEKKSEGIGWGFHDAIEGIVYHLARDLGGIR